MFSYSFNQNDHWARVTAVGEIDLQHTARFSKALDNLEASGAAVVEIDLQHVTYINSEGVGRMIILRKRIAQSGGVVRLLRPNPTVLLVLQQCGLEQFLNVSNEAHEKDDGWLTNDTVHPILCPT